MQPIKIGDIYPTWFSGQPSNMSTVIKVLPYNGKYPRVFNTVLRLSAPNTKKGWIEMAVKL